MPTRFVVSMTVLLTLGCATQNAQDVSSRRPPIRIASDADIDAILPALANWGRWGASDQLGTLNHITPDRLRAALELVTDGRSVSLARAVTLRGNDGIRDARYEMRKDDLSTRDYLGGVWHGFAQTHIDALCHAFASPEAMYNRIPTTEVTDDGCGKLGIDAIATRGVVGRGVLVDVGALHGGALEPGTAITIADLDAALRRQRTRVRAGDILIVRTGAGIRNTRERRAGLHPECLVWVKERQVAMLISDGDNDVSPLPQFDRWSSAFHSVGIPYLGLPLIDNADLEELARIAITRKRWDFLLVVAPWRMVGATSSPINPVAVF